MQEPTNELVMTLRPDGRKGTVLLKTYYVRISAFMLSTLSVHEFMTLNNLVEAIQVKTGNALDCDIAWYVLQVKLDLEARNLIKVIALPYDKKPMYLKLTRKGTREARDNRIPQAKGPKKQIVL